MQEDTTYEQPFCRNPSAVAINSTLVKRFKLDIIATTWYCFAVVSVKTLEWIMQAKSNTAVVKWRNAVCSCRSAVRLRQYPVKPAWLGLSLHKITSVAEMEIVSHLKTADKSVIGAT